MKTHQFPDPMRKIHKIILNPISHIGRQRRYESTKKYQPKDIASTKPHIFPIRIQNPPLILQGIKGWHPEKLDDTRFSNNSNGATSSTTDGMNNSARSHSPIENEENTKESIKIEVKLPQLHLTCCNFFQPSYKKLNNPINKVIKENLANYFSKMCSKREEIARKIFTSKGRKRCQNIEEKEKDAPKNDIKNLTNTNFYNSIGINKLKENNNQLCPMSTDDQRPESRYNLKNICTNLEGIERRPCTSIKMDIPSPKNDKSKERGKLTKEPMFSIDEELFNDDL